MTGTIPDKVVPVRHPLRWVAAAALLVLLAQITQGLVRNPRLNWHVVGHYLFDAPVLRGVVVTLELTAVAMTVGIVLGMLVAIGRLSDNPVVSAISWLYVYFFRGVPVLVQILFWFNITAIMPTMGLGVPFGGPEFFTVSGSQLITKFIAASLGLGLSEAAYYSEIVRAGLLSVDEGQTEAASALGMTRWLVLRRVVLPQAARVIVPPTGNEVISMLKTSALASLVALTDLTYAAQLIYNANYEVVALLVVAMAWYLFLTTILTVGQYYLERHYSRGSSRALPVTPLQRLRLLTVGAPRLGRGAP